MNACIHFLYKIWFIRGISHRDTFKIFNDDEWVFIHADFVHVMQFISQKFEYGTLMPWISASFPELKKPPMPYSFESAKKIHDYVIDKSLNDKNNRGGLLEWE